MLRYCLLPLSLVFAISSISAQGGIEGAAPQQPAEGAAPLSRSGNAGPQAALVIVPKLDANRMTRRGNSIPWSWTPTHFQAIYEGKEMPPALVIGCIGLRTYRSDTGATVDMEIKLGFTKKNHHTMTTSYATNLDSGTPVTVFKRQKYKFPDNAPKNNLNPAFFQVQIPLDTKFVWTRQPGRNIIVIVKVWGNTNNNRSFSWFPENSSVGSTGARLYSNNNVNATTGFLGLGLAPVMSFDTTCKINGDFTAFGKGCPGTGGFSGDVVPAAYAAKMGEQGLYYGFGRANMRWQQVLNGKELRVPKAYTGLSLRQDDRITGRAGGPITLKMLIGNTKHDENALTMGYDHNWDSGTPQTVFNGTMNVPSTTGLNKDPGKFISYVKFTKPFLWIPKKGEHLLIETVQSSTINRAVYMDHARAPSVPMTQVYAFSATATRATSSLANRGFVMGLESGSKGSAIPNLGSVGHPVIGKTFNVTLSLAKATSPIILLLGGSNTTWGVIPLPLSMASFGAPGCNLLVSADLMLPGISDAKGNASAPFPVPNDTKLVGAKFFNQYIVVDPTANGMGLAFSNGGTALVGEQ